MSNRKDFDINRIPRINVLVDPSLTVIFAGKNIRKALGDIKCLGDLFSADDARSLCEAAAKNRPLTLPGVKVKGLAYRPIVCVTPYDQTEQISLITLEKPLAGFAAETVEMFSPEDCGRKGIRYLAKVIRDATATILGCGSILSRQLTDNANAQRYLKTISSCCQELVRISSNLLESVEETSGERLILHNYEFGGFLKEFYGALAGFMQDNKLELKLDLPQGKMVTAFDKTCIERVLVVLVTHMIRNIGSGDRIRIALKDLLDWLEVSISHNGPALSKKRMLSFFEPFSNVKGRGSFSDDGLSLYMCRNMIMRHSGSIYVKANVPGNFAIAFTLPKRTVDTDQLLCTGGRGSSFEKLLKAGLSGTSFIK